MPVPYSHHHYLIVPNLRPGFIFVRFVNNIPAGMAKQKESLIQTFYETSSAHYFDWLTFAESANQITSAASFFSMEIFHSWEKCRLADFKNSFAFFNFFQLKIKQSAQSHLTSCEIKGDLEGYFCWRRR